MLSICCSACAAQATGRYCSCTSCCANAGQTLLVVLSWLLCIAEFVFRLTPWLQWQQMWQKEEKWQSKLSRRYVGCGSSRVKTVSHYFIPLSGSVFVGLSLYLSLTSVPAWPLSELDIFDIVPQLWCAIADCHTTLLIGALNLDFIQHAWQQHRYTQALGQFLHSGM